MKKLVDIFWSIVTVIVYAVGFTYGYLYVFWLLVKSFFVDITDEYNDMLDEIERRK